jgi:pimeloyl-ACP methyl ester carboxylesterase
LPVVTFRFLRRFLRIACAILAAAIVLLTAGDVSYAQTPSANARRPIVFIPGLLGSRLCRANPANPAEPILVWGSVGALSNFSSLRFTEGEASNVKPCGVIREVAFLGVIVQEVYGPAIAHLEKIGYRQGVDLFIFDYDWRRSVFDNAAQLESFVREKIPDPFQRFDVVAHSMGGLIARIFALRHDSASQMARLFSAGTPFQGSAKVYVSLEKGWGTLNPLMGGLAAFRRTMLSFPSIYELAARYSDCCEAGAGRAFALGESEAWRALKWDGVDPAQMPDLKKAAARAEELRGIVDTPLPAGIEDVALIGVDQRTPQRIAFDIGAEGAVARLQTSWQGDATVLRDSAALATAVVHPTSFATHEKILHDPQIQEFLEVALTRDVAEAVRTVKVRPRGQIETAPGALTQLVGIVVEPDQPIYWTGGTGKVWVHVRLGNRQKLRPGKIRLSRRLPDGSVAAIALKPDPAASSGNPLEQSFVGQFNTGARAGNAMLTATIGLANGTRVIERPIAIVAR